MLQLQLGHHLQKHQNIDMTVSEDKIFVKARRIRDPNNSDPMNMCDVPLIKVFV